MCEIEGSVMARLFHLRWNRDPVEARVAALKNAGDDVRYRWSTEEKRQAGTLQSGSGSHLARSIALTRTGGCRMVLGRKEASEHSDCVCRRRFR